jgi:uncharacterized membrane protein (UPF0127 family)
MIFRTRISRARGLIVVCVFLWGGLTACRGNADERPQRLSAVDLVIERDGGSPVGISAEIARTGDERQKGLMYRTALADGTGMLFVFERDQILGFWMKNTLIPLSIAYIAWNGRIVEIYDMQAHNEQTVSSSRSVRYALETPQGWFSRAGIRPGDFLRLDPVLSAADR